MAVAVVALPTVNVPVTLLPAKLPWAAKLAASECVVALRMPTSIVALPPLRDLVNGIPSTYKATSPVGVGTLDVLRTVTVTRP